MKALFTLLISISLLLIACDRTSCDGEHFKPVKDFNIRSFSLETVDYNNKAIDTSLFWPYDSISKEVSIKEKTDIAFQKPPGFSFFTSAYACEPPTAYSVEHISGLDFIARKGFADHGISYQIGDTITNLIDVYEYNRYHRSIESYLNTKVHLSTGTTLNFKYKSRPSGPLDLEFDLAITLSNGLQQVFRNERMKIK